MLDTSTKNDVIKKREDNEKLHLIDLEIEDVSNDDAMDAEVTNPKQQSMQQNSTLSGNNSVLSQ